MKAVTDYAKNLYRGNSKATIYVAGRRNNRCLTVKGNGKLQYVPCSLSFNFLCEIPPFITTECTSHRTSELYDEYCGYNDPIEFENVVIVPKSGIAKEDIEVFRSEFACKMLYLPVNLSTSFPNLRAIICSGGSFTKVTARSFAGLTKVEIIHFDQSMIEELQSEAWKDLTSLRKLFLGWY